MSEVKGAAMELGTERIRKLLVQYAVPAIIAMTASSLYNMVDSIFIGHGVGALAISGLALTFPLMNLAAAFGSLVGVGAATLVSMRLGQRDYETAIWASLAQRKNSFTIWLENILQEKELTHFTVWEHSRRRSLKQCVHAAARRKSIIMRTKQT